MTEDFKHPTELREVPSRTDVGTPFESPAIKDAVKRAAKQMAYLLDALETEHWSDCAVHNAPALEPGPCDCGGIKGP